MGQNVSKNIQVALEVIFQSKIDVKNFKKVYRKLQSSARSSTNIPGFVKLCRITTLNDTVGKHFRKIDDNVAQGFFFNKIKFRKI